MDLICLAVAAGFFGLAIAFVRLSDHIR